MVSPDRLTFGPFALDLGSTCLRRGEEVIPLRRQTFRMLHYLAERPHEVVTPEELCEHVWSGAHVSRNVMRASIWEIRTALGDSAQTPQYVETVRGQGYRFVGRPAIGRSLTNGSRLLGERSRPVVGRQHELAQLQQTWSRVGQGQRQVVMISGEAGIGKTTLVEAFLTTLADQTGVQIVRGQCIERYGAHDAYLPLLSAFERLDRDLDGEQVASVLRQVGPSWLVHLPMLVPEVERDRLQRHAQGGTQAQMLLELSRALEMLTAASPLVLVIEDLHWSDPSTVDALAYLISRDEPAKLLVLGTYRPVEAQLHTHPLVGFLQEAGSHERVRELPLAGLTTSDMALYWQNQLGTPCLPEVIELLEARSQGNALFLAHLVDHLIREELVINQGEGWQFRDALGAWRLLPLEVQHLLSKQLDQLPPAVQQVLEVASVVGDTFSAAAVSAGIEHDLEGVDRLCNATVRLGGFLVGSGIQSWPDGTVSGKYQFAHDLVRQVAYERVGEGPRVGLHRRIGRRLEGGYGERAPEIAVTLATHFLYGHDAQRAVRYLQTAAEQALRRCAHQEALTHCQTGLELLPSLPETPERAQYELDLLMALRPAIIVCQGYTASELPEVLSRIRALAEHVEASPQLPSMLRTGALVTHYAHGPDSLQLAREAGVEQLHLAQLGGDPLLVTKAEYDLARIMLQAGEFAFLRDITDQAIAYCDTQPAHTMQLPTSLLNYAVACRGQAALALWHLGYPDQAVTRVEKGIHLSQKLEHWFSRAFILLYAARLYYLRGEWRAGLDSIESMVVLATELGSSYWKGTGMIWWGFGLAQHGRTEVGIKMMQQEINLRRQRADAFMSSYLTLMATAEGQAGRIDAALRHLAEARLLLEHMEERLFESERYRLHGELLLKRTTLNHAQAESCFQLALDTARQQQAKSLELRAATSLAHLWRRQDKGVEAYELLAPIYNWFTEGFDTVDLQEAKALLDELSVENRPRRA